MEGRPHPASVVYRSQSSAMLGWCVCVGWCVRAGEKKNERPRRARVD